MQKLLIEPHYLGSLEYFVLLKKYQDVVFEVNAHFTKQTYKNRCYILSPGGSVPLSVSVKYGNRTPLKDVRIEYTQSWLKDHKGAISSAYGNAPYFDFFGDELLSILNKRHKFLLDLNQELMTFCLKILQYDIRISFTNKYEKNTSQGIYDAREQIVPKNSFMKRNLYIPFRYMQVFGNKFVPNLSIIDLLMCEGTRSAEVLDRSVAPAGEQI